MKSIPQFELALPDEPFRLISETVSDPDRERLEPPQVDHLCNDAAQLHFDVSELAGNQP